MIRDERGGPLVLVEGTRTKGGPLVSIGRGTLASKKSQVTSHTHARRKSQVTRFSREIYACAVAGIRTRDLQLRV
jgi:hypothetical protein